MLLIANIFAFSVPRHYRPRHRLDESERRYRRLFEDSRTTSAYRSTASARAMPSLS